MDELGEQSKGRDTTKKLVFRHYCKTKMIGLLNERLTSEHKGYIEKTVFNWLLYLRGLPVVGEVIDINKIGRRSVCREYFPEGKVDVSMVVIDVGVSKEELCYGMVKDACEKFCIPFKKQNRGDKEKLISVVEEQTRVIADMQSSINDLRKLVEAKNEDNGEDCVEEPLWGSDDRCQSTLVQHEQQTPVFEGSFEMQQSTMYDRMKAQPEYDLRVS
ncbi:uncharacterized protein HKW66_Vig0104030 [Vigna angularis]|uniref:Uncharacterized protein n=1 Tax=Phaseolus angularis TaxID=3914 RepID=A0A8T0KJA3_PHAAN|nr:uncharacterized protein HKW66_Vig0104030 [Vigna angularis]